MKGASTGKGRYCEALTEALIMAAPKDVHFTLFTRERNPRFVDSARVKQVLIPGKGLTWHWHLRRGLKKHPVDLFLAPTSYIYPALAPQSQQVALVVHDLVALLYPENHHWFPTWVERLTLGSALKKANWIVTVSQHTWKELQAHKPAVKDTAHLIAHPGGSPAFKRTEKHTLELPQRFVLGVGTLQPRKNFQTLFQAFAQLAEQDTELHLCIAGGKGWKSSKIFENMPEHLKERMHFLGYVNEPELIELYSRAEVFVFPSLYEGFGMPPLEAMACECPVVTSNVASLPEVVGEAAIQVDPTDARALAQAIASMQDPETKSAYKKRGLDQAAQFSWLQSAQRLLRAWDLID